MHVMHSLKSDSGNSQRGREKVDKVLMGKKVFSGGNESMATSDEVYYFLTFQP